MINDKKAFTVMNDEENHIWQPLNTGFGDLDQDMQSSCEFQSIIMKHFKHCNW